MTKKEPVNTKYPAFRFRAAKPTDSKADQLAGYVMQLFASAEAEADAEEAEPGHNWFNNPGLKEEKERGSIAEVEADLSGQIEQLKSDLESANAVSALKDKQIEALKQDVADLEKDLAAAADKKAKAK